MAARYIEEIQTIQPEGPYFLGAFCGQGVVVFEIAQQLHAQGQKVALLAMSEARAPGHETVSYAFRRRVYRDVQRIKTHAGSLFRLNPKDKLAYVLEMARSFQNRVKTQMKRRLEKSVYKFYLRVGRPAPEGVRNARGMRGELRKSYVPQVYPGRITLFLGEAAKYLHDPQMGWGWLAGGGVEVHEVSGNHTDMLREPHVQVLADKLRTCLDQAQMDDEG